MQQYVFRYFLAACIIHPLWTMELAGPADRTQDLIMEVEIIEIPYPTLDSSWRNGKRDPGEASPALVKIRLERSPKPRLRGVITQTRESSFDITPTADTACGSEGPMLSRGTSRILKLYHNGETQTNAPEPDISGLFAEPENGATSAASTPQALEPRRPFELSELEMVNIEPGPAAYTIISNRYIIASASFLGGVLAVLSLKRK